MCEDLKWKLKLIHNNVTLSIDCVKIKSFIYIYIYIYIYVYIYNVHYI